MFRFSKLKRALLIFSTMLIAVSLVSFAGIGVCFSGDVIKIGVVASLKTEAGIGTKNAALLAAEEINSSGGILGKKVKIFIADDNARPEGAISAAKKLIYEDNVDIITGGWLSGCALAMADHIFAAKKLWLSSGPATPKLAKMVESNYERAKYFFRVGCVNSDYFAYDMTVFASEFFKKKLGVTKVALLAESSVWAREMAKYLKKSFPENGLNIVYEDIFDPKTTDFSPQFSQIRNSGAEALFVIEAAAPGVPLTKQWAEQELNVYFAGYNAAAQSFTYWDKTGGKCLYEVTQLINGGRAPITPRTIPFYDKYVEKFGTSPTYTAFGEYDSIYLFKYVAEKIKSLDTDKLIKALEGTVYQGVAGTIRFTKNHDLVYGENGKQPVWAQWQGQRKMVVIFPEKWASGEYMAPQWVKK